MAAKCIVEPYGRDLRLKTAQWIASQPKTPTARPSAARSRTQTASCRRCRQCTKTDREYTARKSARIIGLSTPRSRDGGGHGLSRRMHLARERHYGEMFVAAALAWRYDRRHQDNHLAGREQIPARSRLNEAIGEVIAGMKPPAAGTVLRAFMSATMSLTCTTGCTSSPTR